MNLIVRSYTVALTPWEVAAGLIWNLPTHAHAPGVFGPQSGGTGPPPLIGAISMWVEFIFHSLFFFTDKWR